MRRFVSHRILAIVLVLTRLVLGDFMHLPSVQAAAHDATPPMKMMAGEPCPGVAGTPTDHARHPVPADDGTCCKSAQCPCLHAPALVLALPMPVVFSISYADLPGTAVHLLSGPPVVFFRPPIQSPPLTST
jgi:hypothetical protein